VGFSVMYGQPPPAVQSSEARRRVNRHLPLDIIPKPSERPMRNLLFDVG
jgi:hypothetical protein